LKRARFAALALAALFAAAYARAEEDEDKAQAAMRRGVAAFGRGEAEAALEAYEEAKQYAPRANLPYLYAAEALAKLERYPEAIANLEQYLAKKPDVSDAAEVRERILRLRHERLPGRVRLSANVDAKIAIDGASRPEALPAVLTLPPGKHIVAWTAEGYEPVSQEVLVTGDEETSVAAVLAERREAQKPTPAPPRVDPVWETVGWATLGTGAAGIGLAFVLDVTALRSKKDAFEAAANRGDGNALALQDEARSLRTGVTATYIAGGVLTAAGITVLLLSPREKKTSFEIEPRGVRLRGVF
jgi:tetratricopeptide (TPR) repeat protein